MPVVGERRAAIIVLLFCLCLPVITSGIAFASSGNWVEVARFTGGGSIFGATPPFVIDHVEWRIRWEYVPLFPFGSQTDFDFWVVPEENRIEGHFSSDMGIAGVNGPVEKNGTLYFPDLNGTFYLHTVPGSSEWTIIIEQNIDSIPEFPISIPLLIIPVVFTVALIIYKRKLNKGSIM